MVNYVSNDGLRTAIDRVERAKSSYSTQPRYTGSAADIFSGVVRWVHRSNLECPPLSVDNRERDIFLREFWKKESHLAGVVNSVNSIDQNRAWTLIGGRNQVARYNRILRGAEDGDGWRQYIGLQSLAYYTADVGAFTEVGRQGRNGPMRALYNVDPAKCRLTGDPREPLIYDRTDTPWRSQDFFRVVSLQSTDEDMYGMGYSAVSRCLDLAQLMVAIYEHDQEKLGARSPKGLLLLKGISRSQWDQAMETREAALDGRQQEWFGSVATLAASTADIDAKLVALSQLPDGFDLETWTNLLMYGYALAFGYDPVEFWPVQSGALGRGRETEIQQEKATGKGGSNFMLSHQDQLQMQLPETIEFTYEERDTKALLVEAEVAKAWADVAKEMYEQGAGVLSRDEARSLLAQQNIIPPEWTTRSEDAVASDESAGSLQSEQEDALSSERVLRAIYAFPDEPIVRLQYPSNRMTVLWERGRQAVRHRSWLEVPALPMLQRQGDDEDMLYEGDDFTITLEDVERAIGEAGERVDPEFAELLGAPTVEFDEDGEPEERTLIDAELADHRRVYTEREGAQNGHG